MIKETYDCHNKRSNVLWCNLLGAGATPKTWGMTRHCKNLKLKPARISQRILTRGWTVDMAILLSIPEGRARCLKEKKPRGICTECGKPVQKSNQYPNIHQMCYKKKMGYGRYDQSDKGMRVHIPALTPEKWPGLFAIARAVGL